MCKRPNFDVFTLSFLRSVVNAIQSSHDSARLQKSLLDQFDDKIHLLENANLCRRGVLEEAQEQ